MSQSWTKAQHVEHGTWWDREGDPPQEVLDARQRHGLNQDGGFGPALVEVEYCGKLYDVARTALTNERELGHATVKLETAGPEGSEVSGTPKSGYKVKQPAGNKE